VAVEPTNVVNLQERRLDRTVLRTYRTRLDIDEILPHEESVRLGPKTDEELQRQIEANGEVFEPILVEPHPQHPRKFRIIDGGRRWSNSRALVEQGKERYRRIPVEVTDETLSEEDRLRVWIYLQKQRRDWDAREKEMAATRLVELIGRASAANMLDVSLRELDKYLETYRIAEKFNGLRDPSAAITWAREVMGISKKLLSPSVIEAIVKKVNQKRVTSSKDIRKLRAILPDPVARDVFLSPHGDIEAALLRVPPPAPKVPPSTATAGLTALIEGMNAIPWTTLEKLKGDKELLSKLEEAEVTLKSLRKALV
jgi:ParB family chromosome partitioning protein